MKVFKFIGRMIILPISLIALLLTAFMESISLNPDWNHWKNFNEYLLSNLPWKPL